MKNFVRLFLLAAASVVIGACSEPEYEIDNLIPSEYNKILYILDSGEKSMSIVNTESEVVKEISVVKAGKNLKLEASVNVNVMTQDEIDEKWSNLTGRPHYLLPADCYSVSGNNCTFGSDDVFQKLTVTFHVQPIINFITQKKAEDGEDAAYNKYVLPLMATGATPADSVNSTKNWVMYSIDNIAFSAPDQLYIVGPGVDEADGYLSMSRTDNTFSAAGKFNGDVVYLADASSEDAAQNFFTLSKTGKLDIGKTPISTQSGLMSYAVNFDNSTANVTNFGDIDHFIMFMCTYNREYTWNIDYVGNGRFEGQGKNEWKPESWSWDNYADTRYKFRAYMADKSVKEFARHDNASEVPNDTDVANQTTSSHFWMADKGTDFSQWSNGAWKYHYSWHHDGTGGFTQENNVDKILKVSVYINDQGIFTHNVEVVE